jgi:hypothetical protein
MFESLQLQFDDTDELIKREPFIVSSCTLVSLTVAIAVVTWITKQPYLGFFGAICLIGGIVWFRRWPLFRQMAAEVGFTSLLATMFLAMSMPSLFH